MNERLVVKIADFGLSRHLESHEDFYLVTSKNFLPVKWLALESLMDQIFDKITDVVRQLQLHALIDFSLQGFLWKCD